MTTPATAMRRLRHSIATSAGMHKAQIRHQAERMRADMLQRWRDEDEAWRAK
jgi:hypothetical protein